MPDVGDPKVYLTGATAIISEYPLAVMSKLADPSTSTRVLKDRPSLLDIRKACDELQRDLQRELIAPKVRDYEQQARMKELPPPRPKRTAEEQAHVNRVVEKGLRAIREHAELVELEDASRCASYASGANRVK
jgi:hypothetical protein